MKFNQLGLLTAIVLNLLAFSRPAAAQGTAFTYQGRLNAGGAPATGNYDLRFGLYTTGSGGAPVATLVTNANVAVSGGLFTTTLDFGSVFGGNSYFIEIGVRPAGNNGAFATLTPRQSVTPAPYALYAPTAGSVTGVIGTNNLPPTVALVNNPNFTGTITGSALNLGSNSLIAPLTVTPRAPSSAIGSLTTGSQPLSLAVAGRYVYIVDANGNSLQIVDASNPNSPVAVGSATTAAFPVSVAVAGRYAYVVSYTGNTLQIFDISNPASPTLVSTLAAGTNPYSVAAAGRYVYVASFGSSAMQVVDVNNPAKPVIVGSVGTASGPISIAVSGRYAYVGSLVGNSLQIFDVNNPAAPTLAGAVSAAGGPSSVAISGRYAAVATTNSLQIFDVNNPASPTLVGSISALGGPRFVALAGRYVYVVNENGTSNGLQVYDLSNPATPQLVGSAPTSTSPADVAVSGRYVYVVDYNANLLQIFDFGGAYLQQLEAGSIETGSLQIRDALSVGNNLNVRGGFSASGSARISGGLSVDNGKIIGDGSGLSNLVFNTTNTSTAITNFTGPLLGDVTGVQSATVVSTVGGVPAANVALGASAANAATNANTPGAIVRRDASGNFSANNITGSFTGNGAGLSNLNIGAGTVANFSGPLAGDVTGNQSATVVSTVGGVPASMIASGATAANAASSVATPNTLVARNGSGGFSAGNVTGSFTGNGAGLVNLNAASLAGTVPNGALSGTYSNPVQLTNTTNVLAGTFTGNGAGLTNLNITAGTVANFTGPLAGDVSGTQSATVVNTVGGVAASTVASGASAANAATSVATPNTIVTRNGSGGFSAGNITGSFTGNGAGLVNLNAASLTGTVPNTALVGTYTNPLQLTNTTNVLAGTFIGNGAGLTNLNVAASTVANFTGSLAGDVSGTQSATVVGAVGGVPAATVASGATAANAATSVATPNTIVTRNGSGGFAAGNITGSFTGNGAGLVNLNAASLTGNVPSGNIGPASIGNGQLVNNAVTVNPGNGLTGGGTVALGNSITLNTTATSANTPGAIISRDGAGSFVAGNITGSFTGNGSGLANLAASNLTGTLPNGALAGTYSTPVQLTNTTNVLAGTFTGNGAGLTNLNVATSTVANFTGPLAGDVSGTQSATVVNSVGGVAAGTVASGASAANAATSVATPNTIVTRNGSGGFAAGNVTGSFTGNGAGLVNLNAASLTGTIPTANIGPGSIANAQLANSSITINPGNGLAGGGTVALGSNVTLNTTATSANTPNTIVSRDASASFSAGSLTLINNLNLSVSTPTAGLINAGGAPYIHGVGTRNFFAGTLAGNLILTGGDNLGVGFTALQADAGGYANTAIGSGSQQANISGFNNTALGVNTLYVNTNGNYNTAIGAGALQNNVSSLNTALGNQSLFQNTTGTGNTGAGFAALAANTNGSQNTAVGDAALQSANSSNNTAVGYTAGFLITTGSNNIFLGAGAGDSANPTASSQFIAGSAIAPITSVFLGNGVSNQFPASVTVNATAGNGGNIAGANLSLAGGEGTGQAPGGAVVFLTSPTNAAAGSALNPPVERMRITGPGNVGIGKANPATALDVNGTVTALNFVGNGAGLTNLNLAATSAASATNFSGPLAGDVTGTQGATVVAKVGGVTAANVASGANAANAATPAAAPNTIVSRDINGFINAVGINASSYSGNGSGLSNLTAGNLLGSIPPALITSSTTNTPNSLASRDASGNLAAANLQLPLTTATAGSIEVNGSPVFHAFGSQNNFIGAFSGNFTLSGNLNIAFGFGTLHSLTTGANNVALGADSLSLDTTGNQNTGIGFSALGANTTGSDNTATGLGALSANTNGFNNTATGVGANSSNLSGNNNTSAGFNSLFANSTGSFNVAEGANALFNNNGNYNVALGYQAGASNTLGTGNIFLGRDAGDSANPTVDGQLIAGSGAAPIGNVYFGNGVSNNAPAGVAINSTAGSGVNVPGGNLVLVGGSGTGNATGGAVTFFTASPGVVSGGASNPLAERMRVTSQGNVGIGKINPATALDVNGTVTALNFVGNGAGLTNLSVTASNVANATNFSGNLAGDVTGTQGATVVTKVGGVSAASIATGVNAANAATFAPLPNTIVSRDAAGFINAAGINATAYNGNGGGLTNLQASNLVGNVSLASIPSTSTNTPNTLASRDGTGSFAVSTLVITSNLDLPATTANSGIIFSGGAPLVQAIGTRNFFAGNAGNLGLTATDNTGVGYQALNHETSGIDNTAVGAFAMSANTSGQVNVGVGYGALSGNTSGNVNTAIGAYAMESNTGGSFNTGIGVDALLYNTFGVNNAAIGDDSMHSNVTGSANVAVGHNAGYYNITGNNNIFLGANSGDSASPAASGQFIAGGTNSAITNVSLGNGLVNTSPASVTINGTAGSGTNIGGADVALAAGAGTGQGAGGALVFLTAPGAATPGTGLNALAERMRVTPQGNVGIGTNAPAAALDVNGAVKALNFVGNGAGLTNLTIGGTATATNFSGSLAGDVTGGQTTTVVAKVGGLTAATIVSGVNAANGATPSLVPSTIVSRDVNGGFSASNITASFTGNGGGLTNLPSASLVGPLPAALIPSASANTPNTLVSRDSTGSFAAGAVTLNGNLFLSAGSPTNGVIFTGANPLLRDLPSQNLFLGVFAGNSTISGGQNTALGDSALSSITSGNANVAVGTSSLILNSSGGLNVALGVTALNQNTTGSGNTAIGAATLQLNSTASQNTAVGQFALGLDSTGGDNTAVGASALAHNSTGALNTALGFQAGFSNTIGNNNIFLGPNAGDSANPAASGQLIAGATNSAITNIYFGNGVVNATPTPVTINATGGAGTDVNGADLILAGGAATGAGSGGSVVFLTSAPARNSGAGTDALLERMRIDSRGNVGIGQPNPANTLDVNGTVSALAFVGDGSGLSNVSTTAVFTGTLAGDVTGTQNATVVSQVGGVPAAMVASGAAAANVATSVATPNTIVTRNGSGGFAAGNITGSFTGNGAGLVNLGAGSLVGAIPDSALAGTYSRPLQLTNTSNVLAGTFTGMLAPNSVTLGSTNLIAPLTSVPNATSPPITTVNAGVGPTGLALSGRLGYVVSAGDSTLQVFDLSKPNSPVGLHGTDSHRSPQAIAVSGGYAYVVASDLTLTSYRLDNITQFNPISSASINAFGTYNSVTMAGHYAYVGGFNSEAADIEIFDITDPNNMIEVGSINFGFGFAHFAQSGRFIYGVDSVSGELDVVDALAPGNPSILGRASTGLDPQSIAVSGRYAYVANNGDTNLQILDISTPANVTNVAKVPTIRNPTQVVIEGSYAYVLGADAAGMNGFLQIIDVTDPKAPMSLGSRAVGGGPQSLTVSGRYAYLVNSNDNTMQVFDLGGAFLQQVEAGSLETGTLQTRGNAAVGNNLDVYGGFSAGDGRFTGAVGVGGDLTVLGVINGSIPANNISGAIGQSGLGGSYINPVQFTSPNNTFAGDGSALTNVSVTNLSGALAGDVTGTLSATVVSQVGGITSDIIAGDAAAISAATPNSTPFTLVQRDADAGFAASAVTVDSLIANGEVNLAANAFVAINGQPMLSAFGANNIFVGVNSGSIIVSGSDNAALGQFALQAIGGGSDNTAIGSQTLENVTTGNRNTAVGYTAMQNNSSGADNTALGSTALVSNTVSGDTAVGSQALHANSTGVGNTALGNSAGSANTTGNFNIFLGAQSGESADPIASNQLIAGSGQSPGEGITNVFIGNGVTNANPENVTINATGGGGTNKTGADLNLAGGRSTGTNVGGNVVFFTSPGGATGTTPNALTERMRVTGGGNVGIGTANPAFTLQVNGSVAGVGAYNNVSDARFKTNILPLTHALDKVMALDGVEYDWRTNEYPAIRFDSGKQIGFVAQQIKDVLPEAVTQDSAGYYSIAYSKVIPVLVEAMKDQEKEIASKDAELKAIREHDAQVEARLAALENALKTMAENSRRN